MVPFPPIFLGNTCSRGTLSLNLHFLLLSILPSISEPEHRPSLIFSTLFSMDLSGDPSFAKLRSMWQFPATHKLLSVFGYTWNIASPTASQLEKALIHPNDHKELIADIHAPFLGISVGPSALKKWYHATFHFVSQHPSDFAFIASCINEITVALSPSEARALDSTGCSNKTNQCFTLPREEELYLEKASPVTRLLVLHTLAEIVLANYQEIHPKSLFIDISPRELRTTPIGTDILGSVYWYFEDGERLYREPKIFSNSDPSVSTLQAFLRYDRDSAPGVYPESNRHQSESRQLSMNDSDDMTPSKQLSRKKQTEKTTTALMGKRAGNHKIPENSLPETEESTLPRRTSGRRRKAPERLSENMTNETRVVKRTRPSLLDTSVRNCSTWETIAIGSDALQTLISRLSSERKEVRTIERKLINELNDTVLPAFLRFEEHCRRNEKKKKKAEERRFSIKRSSRLEAISMQREAEERRVVEEEARERLEIERQQTHECDVLEGIEREYVELSRDIRNLRKSHGRIDDINRDDQLFALQKGSRKVNAKLSLFKCNGLRRSARYARDDGQLKTALAENFAARPLDNELVGGTSEDGKSLGEEETDKVNGVHKTEDNGFDLDDKNSGQIDESQGSSSINTKQTHLPNKSIGARLEQVCITTGKAEGDIDEDFTWDTKDNLPVRVLEKYLFVKRSSFQEVGLHELRESDELSVLKENSDVMGVGIVIPPLSSTPKVVRVEIGHVLKWVIEHGDEPKQWIQSDNGWYELREAADEYKSTHTPTRRKFEICARLGILGGKMRAGQLTYEKVMKLLDMRYADMDGYSEEEILAERSFIVQELKRTGRNSVLQSEFFRVLEST